MPELDLDALERIGREATPRPWYSSDVNKETAIPRVDALPVFPSDTVFYRPGAE